MVKKYAKTAVDLVIKGTEAIMTVMLTIMMISLSWQVFTRFVIKVPAIWTEEIARYSFIYMAMLGAAIGVKNTAHFGVTILTDKLKGKVRNFYFKYVFNGCILISAIILFVYGWEFMVTYGFTRVSPTFLVPMAWMFFSVPFSAMLMIIFAVYNMLFEDYSKDMSLEEQLEQVQNQEIGIPG